MHAHTHIHTCTRMHSHTIFIQSIKTRNYQNCTQNAFHSWASCSFLTLTYRKKKHNSNCAAFSLQFYYVCQWHRGLYCCCLYFMCVFFSPLFAMAGVISYTGLSSFFALSRFVLTLFECDLRGISTHRVHVFCCCCSFFSLLLSETLVET